MEFRHLSIPKEDCKLVILAGLTGFEPAADGLRVHRST